jgi:two-component system phosphate regulon sensor histidine kinase PhoR
METDASPLAGRTAPPASGARGLRAAAWCAAMAGLAAVPGLAMAGGGLAWAFAPALAAGLGGWWAAARAASPSQSRPVAMEAAPPQEAGLARLSSLIIESFALPMVLTGPNEIVLASSATARRLFPSLAAGRPVSLGIRDPDYLAALALAATDATARSIVLDDGAGGVMRVRIGAVSEDGMAAPVIVSVFEDLAEQRATERMRVDFIANASHELRTPLASLLGFIETLQGPARADPPARERFLGIMREQAARMARLIDDLLSLSRAELRAHQQPTGMIDLVMIVSEIVESLGLSARDRGVALAPALPAGAAMIRGDRDDLLRLVENLVENGIRYGRDGGVVEIALTAPPQGGPILEVRDHGPGIPPEHLPRLTERFYRVDLSHSRENGGTGLGLAIVKHLVARHRARLEIESRLGEGAVFRVVFPPPEG